MLEVADVKNELSKAILGWYSFKENASIEYVDSANIKDLDSLGSGLDYIVLKSDFEKEQNVISLLKQLKEKLNPVSGKLFIIMNNRLGIRYFCGDKEIYSQKVYAGIDNYKYESVVNGRMYDKATMREMLCEAGYDVFRFYSVYPGLENPSHIFSEDYIPNENLTHRFCPSYGSPDTVFVEEKAMYQQLVRNGMFHSMANAYLVECAVSEEELCDVLHVTSSYERGKEDALFTIIHGDFVEKKAVYSDGKKRLKVIDDNLNALALKGLKVVKGKIINDSYVMEKIEADTVQLYLEKLVRTDKEKFISEMNRFRDCIMASSKRTESQGDEVILEEGYPDMVPLNCFYVDGEYVFYDQEFTLPNCPANMIIWRMIETFYAADYDANRFCDRDRMIAGYGLDKELDKWQSMTRDFLATLRKEDELEQYHKSVRASSDTIVANRKRMNYSAEQYDKIFSGYLDDVEGKEIFIFGTGKYAKAFLNKYGADCTIGGLIDNALTKQGLNMNGYIISGPDILKEKNSKEIKVIICIKNYESVEKQLIDMGIEQYGVFRA